ncbi:MAG: phytoene/squalene synthase family protein [Ktedonobacterales bacterium]
MFGNAHWQVEDGTVADIAPLPEMALGDPDTIGSTHGCGIQVWETSAAGAIDRSPNRESFRASSRVAGAVDFTDAATVDAAYEHCRQVARTVARTFYYGSLFLPMEKRRASWALYAFCRTVDNIADEPDRHPDPIAELYRWREALVATYQGCSRGPVMAAWADMLRRYPVPITPALDLLDGIAMDFTSTRYETFEDLRLYCYRVAGTVGLLMAPVLGYQDQQALDAAVDLGIGMQLTNILRDIGEDAVAGRIYLPQDDLARFGYTREELLNGVRNEAFVRLIECEMARAEDYYERGLRGVALLDPDARLAIALSAQLYRAILGRIRRNNYDVFTRRARISFPGKLAAVPGTWLRLRLTRT